MRITLGLISLAVSLASLTSLAAAPALRLVHSSGCALELVNDNPEQMRAAYFPHPSEFIYSRDVDLSAPFDQTFNLHDGFYYLAAANLAEAALEEGLRQNNSSRPRLVELSRGHIVRVYDAEGVMLSNYVVQAAAANGEFRFANLKDGYYRAGDYILEVRDGKAYRSYDHTGRFITMIRQSPT